MTGKFLNILRSDAFLVLLITTAGFVFTYFFYGFYYVEYEGLHDALLSGKLSPGVPFDSFYFLFNLGLAHIYSALFTCFPNFDCISYAYYTILFISCSVALYLITLLLPQRFTRLYKILLLTAVYFLVFADHNIQFLVTRVSYMSSGVSLIALVVLFSDKMKVKKNWVVFLLLNAFFTFSALTRVEPALAAFSLSAFFAVVYHSRLRQALIILLYPTVLMMLLMGGIIIEIKTSTAFHMKVEPEIELEFLEKGNMVPLYEMKTRRDSAIYSMAHAIFWSDPRVMSPEYLRSLIKPDDTLHGYVKAAGQAFKSVYQASKDNWHLVLIALFSGLILIYHRRGFESGGGAVALVIFAVSFWVLILIQAYGVKLNDRSFVPLLDLFILCHVFLFFKYASTEISPGGVFLIRIVVVIGFFTNFLWLRSTAEDLKHNLYAYREHYNKIKNIAQGGIVITNNSGCDCFFLSNTPFKVFDFSSFKALYVYDAYVIPFIPSYNKYLRQQCHCDPYDYPSFWNSLLNQDSKVFIVSNPQKLQIVRDYQSAVYDMHLHIDEVIEINPGELGIYQIKK